MTKPDTDENEVTKLEANPGESIDEAITRTKQLSAYLQEPVILSFNNIPLHITESSENQDVIDQLKAAVTKRSEAFRNSPEGKAWAERTSRELAAIQEQIDSLVVSLPDAIQAGERDIIKWVSDFSKINDNMDLTYDKSAIADALKKAGYQRNAREGDAEVKTNPTAFAEWVIGQSINSLESGVPIAPFTDRFALEYEKLAAANSGRADGKSWVDVTSERSGHERG